MVAMAYHGLQLAILGARLEAVGGGDVFKALETCRMDGDNQHACQKAICYPRGLYGVEWQTKKQTAIRRS